MRILDIQKGLAAAGFNPGPLDGLWGRRSIAALRAFQAQHGLPATGVIDAATVAKLPLAPAVNPALPLAWLQEARSLLGLTEDVGEGVNPDILDLAKPLKIPYTDDETPWCGLFVAHCIAATLPEETLPGSPLRARSWARFGQRTKPVQGAVLVFWRDDPNGKLGHVGFYEAETEDDFLVLGGNQNQRVSRAYIPKHRFLEARWPATASAGGSVPLVSTEEALESTTEA